jgi:hypothetical protein
MKNLISSLAAGLKKYRILIFVLGLAVLSVSQQKFVMPLIYDVIKSDLFLVDTNDQGSNLPISTPLSNIAFMHCNNYLKSKAASDVTMVFAEKPLKAWDIGNYEYIVNAETTINSNSAASVTKKYACRIVYNNKSDKEEDALNFDNWSIIGVSDL